MPIKIKIYLGIMLFVILVLGSAVLGMLSISKLNSEITFITGNAWDAVDGSMEGTIGIQSQIITLDAFINNELSLADAKKKIAETNGFTQEALGRISRRHQKPSNQRYSAAEQISGSFPHLVLL